MARYPVSSLSCLLAVGFLAAVGVAQESTIQPPGWWMEQPYGDMSFNVISEFNMNITLDCNDTLLPDGYSFMFWIRPDLQVMYSGQEESFWTLDGTAGWTVNGSTDQIHIYTVQENQFGFYHCLLNDSNGAVHVVKKAINYEEPYYGNGWDNYGKATVIGLVAAGSFLVVAVVLLLISRFLYKPQDDNYSLPRTDSLKDLDFGGDPREGTSGSSSSGSHDVTAPTKDAIIKDATVLDGPEVYVNHAAELHDVQIEGQEVKRSEDTTAF